MKGKIGKYNYIKNKNFYPYKPLWSKNISYKFGQDTYRTTQELLYSIYKKLYESIRQNQQHYLIMEIRNEHKFHKRTKNSKAYRKI